MSLEMITKIFAIAMEAVPLVERIRTGSTGAEKRQAAIDLIVPAVKGVEAAAGREIVDESALKAGAGQAVDGVVKVLNTTIWKPAVPPAA